jgi:fibronectin-binding autotransporter adhesin
MKSLQTPGTAFPWLALVAFSPLSTLHAQTNGTWTTDGPGNWNDGANWSVGAIASGAGAIADFSTLDITGDHLVTLGSPFTIGTLVSQDATTPTHNWTLGGADPLTLDNGASQPVLNVVNQSLAISAPLAGTNGFSKTGSGDLVLSGGGSMTGNVVVSAGTLRLGVENGLSTSAGINIFGGASATRVMDLNGSNQTLSRFVFTPDNSSGNLTINGSGSSKLTIDTTANTELGPGGAITTATKEVIVDLSGLNEFVWNGPANTFRAGMRFRNGADTANTSNSGPAVTGNATVTLAGTNTITAAALAIGTTSASNSGGTSILRLGQTNIVNANAINIGTGGRNNGTLEFGTGLTNPTATLRGTAGGTSRVATLDVGRVANVTNATTWTTRADFSTGELDARAGTLRIGRADTNNQTLRIGTVNGTFSMAKGTLDVTTVIVGQYAGASTTTVNNTFNGNGTFSMSDAAGTVTAENIILADNLGLATGGTSRTTSGTFNLTAGTLEAKTIDKGADTGNATSVTRNFNFTSGTVRNHAGSDLAITSVPVNLTGSGPRTFEATAGQSITLATSTPVSGSGGFTKTGGGALRLQGANTYTGATDVQAGTLAFSNSLPAGAITVDAAATLELANVTLIGLPALDIDGALNLTGPVRVAGPLTAVPGTLSNVLQYGSITGAANLNHSYRSASFNVGATAVDLDVAAGLALTWTGAGGSSWDLNNTVSWKDGSNNPEKFFWADSVTFDSAGSGTPNVNLAAEMQAAGVTVNEATVDYVFSGPGFISGSAGLTKDGAAKLTITTGNTNTGTTNLQAGTLEVGNGGTTGWMGSGDIVNDASLVFNRSNNITVANGISGTGSLTKLGAGAMTVTADNGFAGGTTIGAGALHVGQQTTTGSLGSGAVVNNGTLRLNRADGINPYAYTFANHISGTGELLVGQNTGGSFDSVATLTGTNTFAGNITVVSGGVRIVDAAALGTGPKIITLTNGTNGRPQFYLDGSGGNITIPAGIDFRTSSPFLAQPAIGNLAGDNVIQGNFTLQSGGGNTAVSVIGGSLTLNGDIAANTSSRNLVLGGTVGAPGTINGVISNGTNPVGVIMAGPNTWTLTGDNSYTGTTTLNGGTLRINGDQSLATGTATVNTGATLGGTGTIGGTVNALAGSTVAPGIAIGTLTTTAPATLAGSLAVELDGTSADRLNVGGLLTLTGATLDVTELAAPGQPVYIIATYGSLSGTFAASSGIPDGYQIVYGYNSSPQIALVAGGDAYGGWETLNGIAGAGANVDSDNDGIPNGIEFVVGGDPSGPGSASNGLLPAISVDGTYLNFVFRRSDESAAYAPFVEYGNSLGGWTPAQNGINGVIVTTEDNPVDLPANTDRVTVRIPRALAAPDSRLFARLRVDIP